MLFRSQLLASSSVSATKLQVTASMIEQTLPDANFATWSFLLSAKNGIWAGAAVDFTPAGRPSAITDHTVIVGRTIKASPSDTTVTLTLRPSSSYGTFTLDTALGVLDVNMLA